MEKGVGEDKEKNKIYYIYNYEHVIKLLYCVVSQRRYKKRRKNFYAKVNKCKFISRKTKKTNV